jgi:hypothetical protein
MPRATVNSGAERFYLESLPASAEEEGGWVELKRMSYGQILERRDMSMAMAVESAGRTDDLKAVIDMVQTKVQRFEFKNAIVDHNLEDEEGNKLSFSNPMHVGSLDPRIGEEIGRLIDNMNEWETDQESGKG